MAPFLPPELISEILSSTPPLPRSTLLAVCNTNKFLRSLALPHLYHTISFTWSDPRLDHFHRPLNYLLRSLVNCPSLARYIRHLELVRWNLEDPGAGITAGESKIFIKSEVKRLRRMLVKEGLDAEWWIEKLRKGSLDASAAVILLLVAISNREGAQAGGGLRELRLTLDHVTLSNGGGRTQPECMWKMLSHLLEPSQGSCSLSLSDIQVHGQAFPFLKKAVIKATRYPNPMRLQVYDCDLKDFAVPFLFHSGLEDLELSALDKGPLIWDEALYTIPNSETVKHLSLTNAHLPTLNSLLACTPNLSTLCYTHLRNIIIPEHRWVDYFVLGSALSHVKDTLTTLTLRTFMFGSLDLSTMILGTECGFRGDARALSLSGFTKLRDLTTNLSLLLGLNNESGMSLSQALPEGLEVLRLVDELQPLDGCWWEVEQVANIVGQYMRERGKGTFGGKGRLEKVVFVSDWEMWQDPDVPAWYGMDPSKDIARVANETGVVVQYAWTYVHNNWYFSFVEKDDHDWMTQTGTSGL